MKKTSLYVGVAFIAGSILIVVPAFAAASSGSLNRLFHQSENKGGFSQTIARPVLVGIVTTVSGATLIVSARAFLSRSPVSYTVTNTNPSSSIITAGDRVAVFGTISGNSVLATKILTRPTRSISHIKNRNVFVGRITAITGTQLTLSHKRAGKNEQVIFTPATIFKKNGKSATVNDLAIGTFIAAAGTSTPNQPLTATIIRIIAPRIKK